MRVQALLGAALWRHSTCSEELTVFAKGRKSFVQRFGKAGHAADRGKSSRMLFLKCSTGRGKLKDKLTPGTEHAKGRSRSLPLQKAPSNAPCLALLQAPGNWPPLQRSCLKASTTPEMCTNKNKRDTRGHINSTSQVKRSHLYSTSEFEGSLRERGHDGFCQLAKQKATATRSKKPRAIAARA